MDSCQEDCEKVCHGLGTPLGCFLSPIGWEFLDDLWSELPKESQLWGLLLAADGLLGVLLVGRGPASPGQSLCWSLGGPWAGGGAIVVVSLGLFFGSCKQPSVKSQHEA